MVRGALILVKSGTMPAASVFLFEFNEKNEDFLLPPVLLEPFLLTILSLEPRILLKPIICVAVIYLR